MHMDEDLINLTFGLIFLILIINTTILFSVVSPQYGQNFQPQIVTAGTVQDSSHSDVPKPVPTQTQIINRAAVLADSGIIIPNTDPSGQIQNQQPIINRAAVLTDPKITVPVSHPSGPAPSLSSYLLIETPAPHEIKMRPTLQPGISRKSFEGFITLYALTNQNLPIDFPRISLKLVKPPLVIDYNISPINSMDIKYLEHKELATVYKENIVIARSYENSWFRVVVRDKDTGEIVEEDGFGRTYSFDNQRQLVVRTCGNYTIEFSGEDATVDLAIRVQDGGIMP
jgi:hypothetical protein